jgi:multidrug resistance efflux pump
MDMMNRPQFSKEALDKARSPERLDTLFSPTTSLGWAALASVLLILLSGAFWAVFGVLSDKVVGVGLIVNAEGVANITHAHSARVSELKIDVGQRVRRGDLVAVLWRGESETDLANLKSKYATYSSREQLHLDADIQSAKTRLATETLVVSPYSGVIIEKKVMPGEIIHPGQALFAVEIDDNYKELAAVTYIPAFENKKVKPGMTVQISISAMDSKEQGYLLGRVINVSQFPVSTASVMKWTGNKELADWLISLLGNSASEVQIALIKDENNPSGYMWSNIIGGGQDNITSGTVFVSSIVYKRQSPLTKAFFHMSQWLRHD